MDKREKRSNAGNRMSQLLDEEEACQEFMKYNQTNYGGFDETDSDSEYEEEEEEEGEDVDSDFSIDENDEPISDNEEDGPKNKRRRVARDNKEPVPGPSKQKTKSPKPAKPVPKVRVTRKSSIEYERKSTRESTAANTAATTERIRVRNLEQKKKVKKPKEEQRMPTQEELLEEAKITELENIKSLEKYYQKLESEKKSQRTAKKTISGPVIQYRSTRQEEVDQDGTTQNVSRTFITVLNDPNDTVFNSMFPKKTAKPYPQRLKCTITGEDAKYVDPVTSLPYHSSMCLKIIRSAYDQYLKVRGDKNDPQVANWLKWYDDNKEKLNAKLAMSAEKTE